MSMNPQDGYLSARKVISPKFALLPFSGVRIAPLLCCRCPPSVQYGLRLLGVFAKVPSLKNSG
jgi:hypothetical protein